MSSWIDTLYSRSPVWLQQIGVAAWGMGWYRRRFGPVFHRLVDEFRERDYWTADQFHRFQEARLALVIQSAWNSPYYREVFEKAAIRRTMEPWEALGLAPFLSKETLRARPRDLLTQKSLPRGTKVFKTSGTTGTPSEIFLTREFHTLELAVAEARNLHVAGVTYRDRRVMFGVRKVCRFDQDRPPFWRYSPVENMAYASVYHLSPRFLPHYIKFLRKYRPKVVMGYPSALSVIARYALDRNTLPAPAKAILTTSETVSPQARETIEAAFQCRLFDRYGSVENCLFAGQCEHGRYHVSPEMGVVEIVDQNGQPSRAGVLGEVVCTSLHNTLQPLIRYQIGDVAYWAEDQHCKCGRKTPIMGGIEGRFEDMCFTPDGRRILRFDTVFKGITNIKEAQVVQQEITRFVVRVVPSEGFDEHDVELIKTNMRLHVGNVETQVEQVDMIQRSPSGKFRAVLCELSPEDRCKVVSHSVTT